MGHRERRSRHERLKNVPHPDEHKKDDGSIDVAAVMKDAPSILAAVQSGDIQILDIDRTDPDSVTKEFYTIFRCKAK